jgi:hypothetical protein
MSEESRIYDFCDRGVGCVSRFDLGAYSFAVFSLELISAPTRMVVALP